MRMPRRLSSHLGLVALSVVLALPMSGASIEIVNDDDPGVGFNDTTAATPIGGNSGTTLGQQRLNVFNAAAEIWGARLQSTVTIKIRANFGPLTPCSTNSGVLGSAGPTTAKANFTNAPRINTWYPAALASALSGIDQGVAPDGAHISASFNSNIGTAGCLTGTSWYLGLDNNHGGQLDLLTVLLHEFGHGLGFLTFVDLATGAHQTYPDTFEYNIYDNSTAKAWTAMTNGERLTSITNTGNVVFTGTNVVSNATILSVGKDGSGRPKLYAPSPVEQGSSISHYDTTASPNQLMEPSLNSNLTHSVDVPEDLSTKAMIDIGWIAVTASPRGDFNDDNNADLVWRNQSTGANAIWLLNGTSYSFASNLPALPNSDYIFAGTPDIEGDGDPDLILRNTSTGANAVWVMNNTSFSSIANLPTLSNTQYVIGGTGDFDGNNSDDILWRNTSTGANAVWLMNGTSLSSVVNLPTLPNTNYQFAGVGDFDKDGDPDIVLRNYSTGQTALWIMNGTSYSSIVNLPTVPNTNLRIEAISDYDGDGDSDIVWRNYSNGSNAIWIMNNTSYMSTANLPTLPNTSYKIGGPR